ncbi:zinc transporter, ZIP family [Cribrihabitans marinus]|uniref:Zinc transporter, ZIP family n=1 Tax=Cribrihabitans marinus TaxID=1227549 RepID=A0A1H7DGY0_9RHOB|nr:divalent cation transporter [Cribrihabitans marinus]GGH38749.1 divalent cation transporter [Cribrihabitans marinus]SEK00157.1 zinc transporter, ZIP family [Cribrihabitans marinus]
MEISVYHALILALLAGLAIPLGGVLARCELAVERHVPADLVLGIAAFGGGALLSAVALVLIPEGVEALHPASAVILFATGGLLFFAIDRALERAGGGGALLLAMLLDFVPEAMALGALLISDPATAILLAGMIFLQNVPEGFAAFREVFVAGRHNVRHILLLFLGLAAIGPVCAGIGFLFLVDQPVPLGAIMVFSAGGILYLLFQDVAPAAHRHGHWLPALGSVGGFALGLAGHLATV